MLRCLFVVCILHTSHVLSIRVVESENVHFFPVAATTTTTATVAVTAAAYFFDVKNIHLFIYMSVDVDAIRCDLIWCVVSVCVSVCASAKKRTRCTKYCVDSNDNINKLNPKRDLSVPMCSYSALPLSSSPSLFHARKLRLGGRLRCQPIYIGWFSFYGLSLSLAFDVCAVFTP